MSYFTKLLLTIGMYLLTVVVVTILAITNQLNWASYLSGIVIGVVITLVNTIKTIV